MVRVNTKTIPPAPASWEVPKAPISGAQHMHVSSAIHALENGRKVRECAGGTDYQPPLEDKAIADLKKLVSRLVSGNQQGDEHALKLAQLYDDCAEAWKVDSKPYQLRRDTAAELRRLVNEVKFLRALVFQDSKES